MSCGHKVEPDAAVQRQQSGGPSCCQLSPGSGKAAIDDRYTVFIIATGCVHIGDLAAFGAPCRDERWVARQPPLGRPAVC